jgi:hypothetical protein
MPFEQKYLDEIDRRIRHSEELIERLTQLIACVAGNPQLRYTAEKLLTEFKIALRGHRRHRQLAREVLAAERSATSLSATVFPEAAEGAAAPPEAPEPSAHIVPFSGRRRATL